MRHKLVVTRDQNIIKSGGQLLIDVAKNITLKVMFCISLVSLTGCSVIEPKYDEELAAVTEINKVIADNESANSAEVPEDVAQLLMAPTGGVSQGGAINIPRFDVSVNRVPAKAFFLSLVADSGVNVVAHPEISGSISLELKNVSVEEVLDVVRDVYGYEYKITNGIYTIFPRKLRTEIFTINYLDVQRVGVTDTSVLVGEISSSSGGQNSSRNSGGSSNSSSQQSSGSGGSLFEFLDGEKGSSKSTAVSPGTRVQTLSKTDFWTGLNRAVLEIIGGDGEGRFVMTNPQSGLVVVKAMPREISSVREFLERSELSAKRQVVLEAKILEVTLNDGYESGVNWGAISGAISMQQVTSGEDTLDQVVFGEKGLTESFVSTVVQATDITKLIQMLEVQGSVQVLSSPRVSTVNNQKAVIRVGSDEFFVTGVSNSTTSSAASVVNTPEVELNSFFSGISLDVTPQISAEGDVILHIHPMVSEVKDQLKEFSISGEVFSLPLALRDVRESDSIVKAQSGQVVVLGGLMQESSSESTGKRPLLGDIPILNSLFKTRNKGVLKTELVILLKPTVVDESSKWQDVLKPSQERMGRMSESFYDR